MIKRIAICIGLLLAITSLASADIFSQNFDNVAGLAGDGWVLVNHSAPVGATGWFQGNPGVLPAHSGAADSYIAANYLNADFGGTIDNWLLTPVVALDVPQRFTFFTRTETGAPFADRLELRLSTSGGSTDVGDFGLLLLTVNPSLLSPGYPEQWTRVGAVLTNGFAPGTTGRYAFRYSVPDTSAYGDYIGIDTVALSSVPEPATIAQLALVVAGIVVARRNRRRRS